MMAETVSQDNSTNIRKMFKANTTISKTNCKLYNALFHKQKKIIKS